MREEDRQQNKNRKTVPLLCWYGFFIVQTYIYHTTINGRAYKRSHRIEYGAYVFKCNNSSIKSRLLESLGTLCWPPNLFFCLSLGTGATCQKSGGP